MSPLPALSKRWLLGEDGGRGGGQAVASPSPWFCLSGSSLGIGGQGDGQEAPLKVLDPSCAFSQHEENALSLLQVALTFLAEAGK